MKILFISMPSIHFIRWIENLKETDYELYWFDVLRRGEIGELHFVSQFTGWKKRKIKYIKGEYFLSKKTPLLYEKINRYLEVSANEALDKIILEIEPDVIHSFEMQSCSYPILRTMTKHMDIKWIYSCWGNDLYYYKNFPSHSKKIKNVLQRIDFLHTDCERDFVLAKQLGFSGQHVGVIPGGTGYKLNELEKNKLPISERKIILVKGYDHKFGRGLKVLEALNLLQNEINNYDVVVFGAHQKVIDYVKLNNLNFKVYNRNGLSHTQLMELMGKSLFYIGNSISDGMANTLLEAIVMGAFPIQSNPGNVTAEIIEHGVNGLLINNPESIIEIRDLILKAIDRGNIWETSFKKNEEIALQKLDYTMNQNKVIEIYKILQNANRI